MSLTSGFATHTIIPGDHLIHQIKPQRCIQNISSVAVGTHGSLVFLCGSKTRETVYKALFHNPV